MLFKHLWTTERTSTQKIWSFAWWLNLCVPIFKDFKILKKAIYIQVLFKHVWTLTYHKEPVLEKELWEVLLGDSISVYQ